MDRLPYDEVMAILGGIRDGARTLLKFSAPGSSKQPAQKLLPAVPQKQQVVSQEDADKKKKDCIIA